MKGDLPYYCVKMLRGKLMAEKSLFASTKREIEILTLVRDVKGCCSLVDIVYDSSSLGLVFPFYPHGDLDSFIKQANRKREIPLPAVREIFVNLVKCLQALHAKGVVHRDLKHQNILVDCKEAMPYRAIKNVESIRILITDFGFAIKK